MTNKKTINPFKLWGSYLGFITLFLFGLGFCISIGAFASCPSFSTQFVQGLTDIYGWIRGFIFGIFGFLIGYGLHLLIRRIFK